MKVFRVLCSFALLTALCLIALPLRSSARQLTALRSGARYLPGVPVKASIPPAEGGIKEQIPGKFKERYQEWKNEFLATDTGRKQWEKYSENQHFTLTITMSSEDRNGAGTAEYKWDDSGTLVAATITLGSRIDRGYPNPIYYPVMNALGREATYTISGAVLAGAKIAHEFGHVNKAASTDGNLYRLQNQLMPAYNKILLSNGRNTRDPRLLDLAKQMGGTPVEIWEDREYWGEANAMLYLRDKITKESEHRAIFGRIMRSVEMYAKDYAQRFDEIAQ